MDRIRYSEEVRQDALRQILENHASAQSVAEQIGCTVNSIHGWLRRHRQSTNANTQKADATFLPVRLVDYEQNENNRIKLTLSNGLTLKIADASPEFVARIVREIASC